MSCLFPAPPWFMALPSADKNKNSTAYWYLTLSVACGFHGGKREEKQREERILSFKYLRIMENNWFQARKEQNSVLLSPISPELKKLWGGLLAKRWEQPTWSCSAWNQVDFGTRHLGNYSDLSEQWSRSRLAAPHAGKEPCGTTAPTGMGLIVGAVPGFRTSETPHKTSQAHSVARGPWGRC